MLNDRIDVCSVVRIFDQSSNLVGRFGVNGRVNRSLIHFDVVNINVGADANEFSAKSDVVDIFDGVNQKTFLLVFDRLVDPVIFGKWKTIFKNWKLKIFENTNELRQKIFK